MSPPAAPAVAVVGAARCAPEVESMARSLGRELAAAGALVLTGGRGGVMAAASRGAREAGGTTVGILPGADRFESPPDDAVTIPLFTGLGQARNLVLVLSARAVVAVGGAWGTLSEIALAMKHGRPVVLLDSWALEPPAGFDGPLPSAASSPAEAARLALDAIAASDAGGGR